MSKATLQASHHPFLPASRAHDGKAPQGPGPPTGAAKAERRAVGLFRVVTRGESPLRHRGSRAYALTTSVPGHRKVPGRGGAAHPAPAFPTHLLGKKHYVSRKCHKPQGGASYKRGFDLGPWLDGKELDQGGREQGSPGRGVAGRRGRRSGSEGKVKGSGWPGGPDGRRG